MEDEIRDDVVPQDEVAESQELVDAPEPLEEDSAPEPAPEDEPEQGEPAAEGEPTEDASEPAAESEPTADASEPAMPSLGDTAQLAVIEESLAGPAAESEQPAEAVPGVPAEPVAAEQPIAHPELDAVDLGPERRSNLWVWIGLGVGVLIAAAAIGYAWWYTTSRPIIVPNVTGKLPAQAAQALNDAGLRLGKVSEMPTDTAPAGTVISQSPEALDELKPNATVSLVLAAAPETSKVPDVSGRALAEARQTLIAARLDPTPVESFSSTVAAGYVISQLPTVGTELVPGGAVALVVSKGGAPSALRVPQLSGLPEQDAAALLASLDIVALQYRSVDGSIPAGVVVTQTPLPGTQVVPGSSVQYLVSDGLAVGSVTVPDVTAKSRKDAEKALKDRNLKVEVRGSFSATVKRGEVISQMPFPKMRVGQGGTVGIVVSRGASTETTVPALFGKPSEEASKAAVAAGLRPYFIEVPIGGFAQGTVFSQFPASDSRWPRRFPLVALVAKTP